MGRQSMGASNQAACRQVLVVDDCPDNVELLQTSLSGKGYPVRVAYDGAEALDLIEASPPPEAIVLDLSLPQVDGFDVARMARARLGTEVKIIALTGLGSAQDRDRALRAGCDVVLVKPCPLASLYELLEDES
jgi:CheY-like chemotaxis protein